MTDPPGISMKFPADDGKFAQCEPSIRQAAADGSRRAPPPHPFRGMRDRSNAAGGGASGFTHWMTAAQPALSSSCGR